MQTLVLWWWCYIFFTSAWILPISELNCADCQLWVIHKSFHLHVTFISQPYICPSFITRNWYPSFPLALLTKLLYRPMIPLIYYYLNKKSIKDIKIIPRFMAKRKLYDLRITLWRSNIIKVWFSLWNYLNFTHLGHVSLWACPSFQGLVSVPKEPKWSSQCIGQSRSICCLSNGRSYQSISRCLAPGFKGVRVGGVFNM